MRKKKKSEEGGFNVWRSYSDMMAGHSFSGTEKL